MGGDTIESIGAFLIGIITVAGGLLLIYLNPNDSPIVVPLMLLVLTFFFANRTQHNTMNGTISAMSNIAQKTQEAAATTVANTVGAASEMRRIAAQPPVKQPQEQPQTQGEPM